MAMPSAAKRTAMSTMNPSARGMAEKCAGRKPAMRQMTMTKQALDAGHRGSAERAADHDLHARHRRDQCLLQEAELAVPEQAQARKRSTRTAPTCR